MNTSTAENLARSAKAPSTRQQVIAANVAWKATNTISGITTPLREGRRVGELALGHVHGSAQEQAILEAAEEHVALGEGEAVAVDAPQHRHQREHHEHLHQHRQRVLRAHHAAVEQRQRRHAHHDDERGRHQHPGDVALVRRRRRRLGFFLLHLGRRSRLVRRCRRLVLRQRRAREDAATARAPGMHTVSSSRSPKAPPHRSRRCGCG